MVQPSESSSPPQSPKPGVGGTEMKRKERRSWSVVRRSCGTAEAAAAPGRASKPRMSLADMSANALASLHQGNRAFLKQLVRCPEKVIEEMQQQSAAVLIQSVFRGKQDKKKVEEKVDEDRPPESPSHHKLSIYQIARAQTKATDIVINAQVAQKRRSSQMSTVSPPPTDDLNNSRKGAGIESWTSESFSSHSQPDWIQRMDDTGIPFEYRAGKSVIGLLLPRFIPRLEHAYQIAEMQRHLGARWYTGLLAATLTFPTLIDLLISIISLGSIEMRHAHKIIFLILSLIWVCIFYQVGKDAGRRRVLLLRNLAAVIMMYVVCWQSFDGQLSPGGTNINTTTLVRILFVLVAWVVLPQPKHLPTMLVINISAPVIWFLGCSLRNGANISATIFQIASIEQMFYFIVFGFGLFVTCRKSDLESRRAFLKSRQSKATIAGNQREISQLKKQVSEITNSQKEFFDKILNKDREKICTLTDTLDNHSAKREMQELHEHLISQYVLLGASDGTGAESIIEGIDSSFKNLKWLAQKESTRLAKILTELYNAFVELPEWEPVMKLPAFVNIQKDSRHPQEKIHQTSHCKWWSTPELFPPNLSMIGIAKDPLQWFACRSQWSQTVYVEILKKAVSAFNDASSPSDLGLSPGRVMRLWNALNPESKLNEPPFADSVSLEADLAATKNHDYIESGQHAGLQVGPTKDRLRVMAKVAEYRAEPEKCPATDCLEKYITDWLRARVVFVSPSALAVFFWYLMFEVPKLEIVSCKNKLTTSPSCDTSCCIHINVLFDVQGEQHLAELQLVLESFCVAKDLEHKYYEFRRAETLAELLAPVLAKVPRPSSNDDSASPGSPRAKAGSASPKSASPRTPGRAQKRSQTEGASDSKPTTQQSNAWKRVSNKVCPDASPKGRENDSFSKIAELS